MIDAAERQFQVAKGTHLARSHTQKNFTYLAKKPHKKEEEKLDQELKIADQQSKHEDESSPC